MIKVKLTNNRGNKELPTTITIDVDNPTIASKLSGAVIRTIMAQKSPGHILTHVETSACQTEIVHAPAGSIGISLRRYLFGPNYSFRANDSKDLDYTQAAFHINKVPETAPVLVYVTTKQGDKKIPREVGIWDPATIQFIRYRGSHSEIIATLAKYGLKLDDVFIKAIEKAFGIKRPAKIASAIPATKVKQANVNLDVLGDDKSPVVKTSKKVDVPANTPNLDMVVNIPIPFTGLNITVHIKTS